MSKRIEAGERQSDREAVDRMTKRLMDGNSDGSGRMSRREARDLAVKTARRVTRGAVRKK